MGQTVSDILSHLGSYTVQIRFSRFSVSLSHRNGTLTQLRKKEISGVQTWSLKDTKRQGDREREIERSDSRNLESVFPCVRREGKKQRVISFRSFARENGQS